MDTRSYPIGRPQRYQDPNSGVVWWGPPQWTHETSLSITDLSTTFMIWDLRTGETVSDEVIFIVPDGETPRVKVRVSDLTEF